MSEIEVPRPTSGDVLERILEDHRLFEDLLREARRNDVDETALAAVLDRLRAGWLAPGGFLVVERSTRSPEPPWPDTIHLATTPKKYGETTVWYATRN